MHSSKKPVGLMLMDQSAVAGVGNIYRAEILFKVQTELAGLPDKAARRLGAVDVYMCVGCKVVYGPPHFRTQVRPTIAGCQRLGSKSIGFAPQHTCSKTAPCPILLLLLRYCLLCLSSPWCFCTQVKTGWPHFLSPCLQAGVHPEQPSNTVDRAAFERIWRHCVLLLQRGFKTGSILTVDPEEADKLGRPWTRRSFCKQ